MTRERAEGNGGQGEPPPLSSVLNRFELVREIGRADHGVVFEARDTKLNRRVAFVLVQVGPEARQREEQILFEAEEAARLAHPNLVTLHDLGRTQRGPYLVMELLQGETLAARLGRGPIPPRETLRVALEMARGVAHAHANHVVHGRLDPENVLLCEDGRVKVLGFGLSRALGWRLGAGGPPDFQAPEQIAGAPGDARSDVYALGLILRRMLPAAGPEGDGGPSPAPGDPSAPPLPLPDALALSALVARMLEEEPARRPRDGAEVLAALQAVAAPGGAPGPAGPARSRHRAWRLAAGTVALILSAAGGLALRLALDPYTGGGRGELVAVADFANDTGDPDLDGLSGLLITSLEQSRTLHVLTRARLMDLVREERGQDVARLDETLARAVGRRASVRALFLASIRRPGARYEAELRALDPRSERYLFTLHEEASAKADLLPLIDRLSERARLALREPGAEVLCSGVVVGEAVTPSLEAYRHYFRGKELFALGRLADGLAEYQRAVEVEPRFAVAKLEIAWVGYLSGLRTTLQAEALVREASAEAGRPPDKEARIIRALAAFFGGVFSESRAELHGLVERYPDDPDVAVLASEVLLWSGDLEGAAESFQRALRLAPTWDILRLDQVQALFYLGRGERALSSAKAAALGRGTPLAWASAGLARFLSGDVPGGLRALESAPGDIPLVRLFRAEGLGAQGRVQEALDVFHGLDDSIRLAGRAQVLGFAGRLREGISALDELSRWPGTDVPYNRQTTAWYRAAAGDLEGARRLSAEGHLFTWTDGVMLWEIGDRARLVALLSEVGWSSGLVSRFLHALSAAAAGDRPGALAELRDLDRKGAASFVPYVRGVLAEEEGLYPEAVDCLARFDGPLLFGADAYMTPWLQARARLLRARALQRLGRREEALRLVDVQLRRFAGADADLQLLADLRALRDEVAVARSH